MNIRKRLIRAALCVPPPTHFNLRKRKEARFGGYVLVMPALGEWR